MKPAPASDLIDAIRWVDCDFGTDSDHDYDQRGVEREFSGAVDDGSDIGSVEIVHDVVLTMNVTT